MKGIAQSNLDYHDKSLKQFYKILQFKSNDVIALTDMGIGLQHTEEQSNIMYPSHSPSYAYCLLS